MIAEGAVTFELTDHGVRNHRCHVFEWLPQRRQWRVGEHRQIVILAQQFGDVWSMAGLNSHLFLILVYTGGAAGFNAFLLKGFLDAIPLSLDEAARIDGAGPWTLFSRIIFPLARPMLAVIFMISFVGIFGEFILASSLLSQSDQLTLPVGLQVFLGSGYDAKWGTLSATALVGAAPIVLVFLVAQKHIIGGLTAGSVKG